MTPALVAASKIECIEKRKNIDYYVTMNRCGRAIMASESSEALEIVEVLTEVSGDKKNWEAGFYGNLPIYTNFQMLYGLLRQSPGAWIVHALGQGHDFIHSHERGKRP